MTFEEWFGSVDAAVWENRFGSTQGTARAAWDAATAEATRSLPQTYDGVAIVPHMKVWTLDDLDGEPEELTVDGIEWSYLHERDEWIILTDGGEFEPSELFSTAEAAKARAVPKAKVRP
jgi:hypothetical protein